MACSTLSGISVNACDSSMGGVKKIWLTNIDEVSAVVTGSITGSNDVLITGITMAASGTWKAFGFRKNTCSMTSTLNVSDGAGSNYVSTELAMVFSKMEAAKQMAMNSLIMAEAAGIVQDSNGKFWYLGYDEPLTMTAGTGETGTAKTDANQYTATMTDESLGFPYEIAPSVIETLGLLS